MLINIIRSRFIELGKAEKSEDDQCCPMGLKTGKSVNFLSRSCILQDDVFLAVQIIGGVMTIISGVMLVVFFAKLDDIISRQYYKIFEVRIICCHYLQDQIIQRELGLGNNSL